MPTEPGGWQSFQDYLQLNAGDIERLQAEAEQRAQGFDAQAQNSLGAAYQGASADLERGGAGDLSGQTSYLDFVKAQREAAAARMAPTGGSAYEQAARRTMAPTATGPQSMEGAFAGRLDARRGEMAAGRTAVDAAAKRAADERAAQAEAFGKAREALIGRGNADIARFNSLILQGKAGSPMFTSNTGDVLADRAKTAAGRASTDEQWQAQEARRRGMAALRTAGVMPSQNVGGPRTTSQLGNGARTDTRPKDRTVTAGPTKGKQSFKSPF